MTFSILTIYQFINASAQQFNFIKANYPLQYELHSSIDWSLDNFKDVNDAWSFYGNLSDNATK